MNHDREHPDCTQAARLAALLDGHELDAALDAGLMDFVPCADCDVRAGETIRAAQAKLHSAWAARERFRAREARLARIATERDARRASAQVQHASLKPVSTLPASAAAVLARAKAKAAQQQ